MPLGVENTEGKIDGRDQIEYAAEYVSSFPGHRFYHRLRSTNPWPDSIQPDLRPAITEYVTHGLDVADRLRDAMCLALNVDPRELAPFFANSDDDIASKLFGPGFKSQKSLIVFWLTDDGQKSLGK